MAQTQHLDLSEENVVPLTHIAQDICGLRVLFVNLFGVISDGGWTLIDAGLPFSAGRIRSWVQEQFGGKPPRAILLTHGHFDHVGAVKDLADEWNVPVYAHRLEAPFLTGQAQYMQPDPSVGGGFMALISPLYPRGPIDIKHRLQLLPEDGSVPTLPGWRAIFTPGHTPGHVSFFRESDRALLVGDAFCTTDQESFLAVARQAPMLQGPPAYFTPDWDQARDSVRKLAALRPHVVAPGHGLPMVGEELARKLEVLAEDFDRIARPRHKQADAAVVQPSA
jgi:glyoxylase-like metal-dependent hydrolase (beta-lactamase superfamily II)